MLTQFTPSTELPVSLAEIKSNLRLEGSVEDALLASLLRVATAQAEDFLKIGLLSTIFTQVEQVAQLTQVCLQKPFVSEIISVTVDGVLVPATQIQLKNNRLIFETAQTGSLITYYRAGAYTTPNDIPEPIRFGIARQVVHLFCHRDAPDVPTFPSAVLALWQPYRQLGLK
jgi:uncharacterized phiE125 gp8 family phage protein